MSEKIRVGIIGLTPGVSWASKAHLPALRSLGDRYEVVGVANSSHSSAVAAASACDIPTAFADVPSLVKSPKIDLVVVTVRVPHHRQLVTQALNEGKNVYCEWPLGNTLAEAEEMADLAVSKRVVTAIGTQARVAPEILHLRRLITEGYLGDVLSTTIVGWGFAWGATHAAARRHMLASGYRGTMLTIPFAHTLSAVRDVLGDLTNLSAIVTNRRKMIKLLETGEEVPFDVPDLITLCGYIGDDGVPITMNYRGGSPREQPGLSWEINGTRGDLRISAVHGGAQQVLLKLEGGRTDNAGYETILPAKDLTLAECPDDPNVKNVAGIYARLADDIRTGSKRAPNFADAVDLHRLLEAIERASVSTQWVKVSASNRPLPVA